MAIIQHNHGLSHALLPTRQVLMVAIRYLALGDNTPFRIWAVWVALISLAVLAPLQLYLLNSMLASGFVSLSVPMYLSLMVLLVAAGGGTC